MLGKMSWKTTRLASVLEDRSGWLTTAIVILSILAGFLVWVRGMNHGIGTRWDSTYYIQVARNLYEGNGFVQAGGVPYRDGAPLFPLSLAVAKWIGIDILEGARYINSIAFSISVFVAAIWLRRRIESTGLILWVVSGCVFASSLGHYSAFAMTESLFIVFAMLALYCVDRFFETNKHYMLLLAGSFSGLALVTRYIGVTIVATGILCVLFVRGTPLQRQIRNLLVYLAIAVTPIGLWILHNIYSTGSPIGQAKPSGFRALYSIDLAIHELSRWILGDQLADVVGRIPLRILEVFLSSSQLDLYGFIIVIAMKLAVLVGVLIGIVWAAVIRRRKSVTDGMAVWFVPVTFVIVYCLYLAIFLPVSDINLPPRYLAPLYIPALVVISIVPQQVIFFGHNSQPTAVSQLPNHRLLRPRPVFRWIFQRLRTLSLAGLVLTASLSLWLALNIYSSYNNISQWNDSGFGYTSQLFTESKVISYVREQLPNGDIWTNRYPTLYFLTDREDSIYGISHNIHEVDRRYSWAGRNDSPNDRYLVWLFIGSQWGYSYRLDDVLNAIPDLEFRAIFADGLIFRVPPDSINSEVRDNFPDSDISSKTDSILESVLAGAEFFVDAQWKVYLDRQSNRLIYVSSTCTASMPEAPVRLHIIPMDTADLPSQQRVSGFENLDFSVEQRMLRYEDFCIAVSDLPDYRISKILTGQFTYSGETLWETEIALGALHEAETLREIVIDRAQLISESQWNVYLDEDEHRLIYVIDDCIEEYYKHPVFLHIFPVDISDLVSERYESGFDNLDFLINERLLRHEDVCMAVSDLPDYPISSIQTGQYFLYGERIWHTEFALDR